MAEWVNEVISPLSEVIILYLKLVGAHFVVIFWSFYFSG